MTAFMSPDSYGRGRSARSVPTGPGSRGGTPIGAEYFRRYRATHPEYRDRERQRQARRREALREARAVLELTFSDGIRDFVRREVERSSYDRVALGSAVSTMTVWRFVNRPDREVFVDIVDAMVAKYGIYRLVSDWRSQVREARRAAV